MASGRSIQLHKQIGEYLVACELARRNLLVATFSGNVPDFDLVASDAQGRSIPIQVKTIRKGQWQFSADDFVDVKMNGNRQVLGTAKALRTPNLVCVLVFAGKTYGDDQFFVLTWETLREIAIDKYRVWLSKKGGVRPKNPKSKHCSVALDDLRDFRDKWELITERL